MNNDTTDVIGKEQFKPYVNLYSARVVGTTDKNTYVIVNTFEMCEKNLDIELFKNVSCDTNATQKRKFKNQELLKNAIIALFMILSFRNYLYIASIVPLSLIMCYFIYPSKCKNTGICLGEQFNYSKTYLAFSFTKLFLHLFCVCLTCYYVCNLGSKEINLTKKITKLFSYKRYFKSLYYLAFLYLCTILYNQIYKILFLTRNEKKYQYHLVLLLFVIAGLLCSIYYNAVSQFFYIAITFYMITISLSHWHLLMRHIYGDIKILSACLFLFLLFIFYMILVNYIFFSYIVKLQILL